MDGADMRFKIDGKYLKDIINHYENKKKRWPITNHLIYVNKGKKLINASKKNDISSLDTLFKNDIKETIMMAIINSNSNSII
jgi:hypothetical protein